MPDNAYYEFYPAEIVDKIWNEHPNATTAEKHRLTQAEWNKPGYCPRPWWEPSPFRQF
jgi:hypothetical protein